MTQHQQAVSFPKAAALVLTTRPVMRIHPLGNKTMKRRVWPICHAGHVTMSHRVPVSVLNVSFKILLVTNGVLPIAALPQIVFTFGVALYGDTCFDHSMSK